MAIDKLNFSGINSGSENFVTPFGSLSERLMKYGSILNQNALEEEKQKRIEMQDAYSKQRDVIQDKRYEADKKEKYEDKINAQLKEAATNENLALISDKEKFLTGKIANEDKLFNDSLASVSDPIEKQRLQSEYNRYKAGEQKKSWETSTAGMTNVDQKQIVDLKRNLDQDAERKREFNESQKTARDNFNKTYSLQKMQYDESLKEKKEKEAGQLAYVNGLNTNVDNSTKILIDSKTGEKYIPNENLNAHKDEFDKFANSPEMIKMKNELVDAQKNGGQIYTKEQLADEKFLYNEYNKLNPKELQKSTLELKGLKIIENEKKDLEIKKLEEQASAIERSGISDFNTPEENMNAKNKAESIRSQIANINNERKTKQGNATGSFEDFVAKIKADNAAKELDLKTKIDKYDSAYKEQDLKLKNKFGKVKQEEIIVPKSEEQYAQDLYNANIAGKTLSTEEKVGFMKAAKEKAAAHRKKVEKDEDDALKIRLKEIEKTSDTNKLLVGEVEKENSSIRQAINDARREDEDKDYSYAGSGGKKISRQEYISELEAQLYKNNNRIDKILGIKK